jgi:hypothetical protein
MTWWWSRRTFTLSSTRSKGMFRNLFINRALRHFLDGDKGSTIAGVVIAAVLGAQINWNLVFKGLETAESSAELAKVVGIVAYAVWSWFIGRKKASGAGSATAHDADQRPPE